MPISTFPARCSPALANPERLPTEPGIYQPGSQTPRSHPALRFSLSVGLGKCSGGEYSQASGQLRWETCRARRCAGRRALPQPAGGGAAPPAAGRPASRVLPPRAKAERRPLGPDSGRCALAPRLPFPPCSAGRRCPSPGYLCCAVGPGGLRCRLSATGRPEERRQTASPVPGTATLSPEKPLSPPCTGWGQPPPPLTRGRSCSWGSAACRCSRGRGAACALRCGR